MYMVGIYIKTVNAGWFAGFPGHRDIVLFGDRLVQVPYIADRQLGERVSMVKELEEVAL